jgi:hypothetical protein
VKEVLYRRCNVPANKEGEMEKVQVEAVVVVLW